MIGRRVTQNATDSRMPSQGRCLLMSGEPASRPGLAESIDTLGRDKRPHPADFTATGRVDTFHYSFQAFPLRSRSRTSTVWWADRLPGSLARISLARAFMATASDLRLVFCKSNT